MGRNETRRPRYCFPLPFPLFFPLANLQLAICDFNRCLVFLELGNGQRAALGAPGSWSLYYQSLVRTSHPWSPRVQSYESLAAHQSEDAGTLNAMLMLHPPDRLYNEWGPSMRRTLELLARDV
jgi:hypothetical protein